MGAGVGDNLRGDRDGEKGESSLSAPGPGGGACGREERRERCNRRWEERGESAGEHGEP